MKSSAKSHGSAGSAVPRFRPSETLPDVITDSEVTFPPPVPLPPGKPSFLVLSLSHLAACCVAPATCSMKHDLPHSGLSLSVSSAPLTISPCVAAKVGCCQLAKYLLPFPSRRLWLLLGGSCRFLLLLSLTSTEATLRLVGKHHVPSGGPEGRNTLAPPGSARPKAPGRRQSGSQGALLGSTQGRPWMGTEWGPVPAWSHMCDRDSSPVAQTHTQLHSPRKAEGTGEEPTCMAPASTQRGAASAAALQIVRRSSER